MKIIPPIERPNYLPEPLWNRYLSDAQNSKEPTLSHCQRLLFSDCSEAMFGSMQSKNGGVAKDWTDRQWGDWLLYASTTATRLGIKDYSAILNRRKEVLAAMERAANELLSLMDESMGLMLDDGVSMPDRAVGMDKVSPPQDRALFREMSELLLDVQYEQTLPVVDWLDACDRRLVRVVNNEPRLRYVAAFLEYTKGCTVTVSDRILAYQCTALYGQADKAGDGFDRLIQSVTKARRAHEKRMKSPEYCLVYFGDPKDGLRIMGYRPFSGDAAFSYWFIQMTRNGWKSKLEK